MASRGIWSKVLTNFIASLRPRKINGNLMGQDYMNTKYYEIPAGTISATSGCFSLLKFYINSLCVDPQGGRRKSSRWFEPHNKENFQQEIPAEWEGNVLLDLCIEQFSYCYSFTQLGSEGDEQNPQQRKKYLKVLQSAWWKRKMQQRWH